MAIQLESLPCFPLHEVCGEGDFVHGPWNIVGLPWSMWGLGKRSPAGMDGLILPWVSASDTAQGQASETGFRVLLAGQQLFPDSQLLKKEACARWNPWALKPNGLKC